MSQKIIRITKCDDDISDGGCPYFKRTPIYDNSDECWCSLSSKDVEQFVLDKNEQWGIKILEGVIPDWCKLEELND